LPIATQHILTYKAETLVLVKNWIVV